MAQFNFFSFVCRSTQSLSLNYFGIHYSCMRVAHLMPSPRPSSTFAPVLGNALAQGPA